MNIKDFGIRLIRSVALGGNMFRYARAISKNRGTLLQLRPQKCVAKRKPLSCSSLFHTGSPYLVKVYTETENSHAHSYLSNSAPYSSTLMKPMAFKTDVVKYSVNDILKQDWSSVSAEEVFAAFKGVSIESKHLSLNPNDPMFENLFSAVVGKCEEYEDMQLFTLLHCLSLWPPSKSIKSSQYYSLWSALDQVCLSRVKKWDINTNLIVIDLWAHLNLVRSTKFVHSSLKKICRKMERLSPQQFVQLMFYVNLLRKLPASASKFEFEYSFEALVNNLTLEELAIASMGFFKTETHLKNPQISDGIISRLESSFKTGDPPPPDSIMLASLLKLLRNGVPPTQAGKLHSLLDALQPHLKNYSLLCCLHVALIGSNIQLMHEGVMDVIAEKFLAEMKDCRIKDIERLAFIMTLFNYNPKTNPSIYEAMVTEIRERVAEREIDSTKWQEIDDYGECFLRFLSYLIFQHIFPLDLIEKAMNSDFIKKSYGKNVNDIGREVFMLDISLEILFPEQMKYRLNPELRGKLSRKFLAHSSRFSKGKRLSAGDRLLIDVFDNVKLLSGSADGVFLDHILPQFERPDVIFCTAKNEVFHNVSPPKYNHTTIPHCPVEPGTWCVLVTGSRNNFVKLDNRPTGPLLHKMLLLEKLGFRPILVPFFEWETLRNNEKRRYLREKIFNS
ncbi:uncharacterized protein LOC124162849 [Ischnura elegans]|uniref:uncharacterized protein LOC124162849 n=1 Tax=Ischnura elegans TaxID=197161 RepID=UPI001ED88157|nr:uncharacterized protein LOC124162849 [Ischnura elegans]